MINKMKKIFIMGAMVFGVSFLSANCGLFDPAQNGPSCSLQFLTVNTTCIDLIDTDAAAMTAFEDDCTAYETGSLGFITSTYETIGCDLTTYDVTGHCEMDGVDYASAVWFSSDYGYTSATAEASCTASGGTWVN